MVSLRENKFDELDVLYLIIVIMSHDDFHKLFRINFFVNINGDFGVTLYTT
jgi:hypothetical protein